MENAETNGFMMDVRCFFGMIFSVLKSAGVVEGGTGTRSKAETHNKTEETVQ